ncbi:MAG: PAS domain-containing protein [Sulfuricurvum sp.]|nr:PAS domain-containing protein [Sulfuricurvum sp.]
MQYTRLMSIVMIKKLLLKHFLSTISPRLSVTIHMLDREARCLFCNRAYLQMTGSTNEKMVQLGCVGLNIHEDPPMALSVLEQVREKGCIENIEKSCVVKDGKKLHVNISITLMPDKESFW